MVKNKKLHFTVLATYHDNLKNLLLKTTSIYLLSNDALIGLSKSGGFKLEPEITIFL